MPSSLWEKFVSLLTEDAAESLMSTQNTLTQDQLERLQEISEFFGAVDSPRRKPTPGRDTPGSRQPGTKRPGNGEGTNGTGKRRKTTDNKGTQPARHQWRPIMNITSFTLPAVIQDLLENPEADPMALLDETFHLKYRASANAAPDELGDSFWHSFEYAVALQGREKMDRCRSNFLDLFFLDFVKFIRPRATGRRVGRLMLNEMQEALSNFSNMRNGMSMERVYENVDKWSRCGMKLDDLSQRFGAGSIFFLHDYLSRDFLLNKSPSHGRDFDEAMQHLEDLGLKELAETSMANELAASIRYHLIAPFEDAKKAAA